MLQPVEEGRVGLDDRLQSPRNHPAIDPQSGCNRAAINAMAFAFTIARVAVSSQSARSQLAIRSQSACSQYLAGLPTWKSPRIRGMSTEYQGGLDLSLYTDRLRTELIRQLDSRQPVS